MHVHYMQTIAVPADPEVIHDEQQQCRGRKSHQIGATIAIAIAFIIYGSRQAHAQQRVLHGVEW